MAVFLAAVHPAELGRRIQKKGSESISETEVISMEVDTAGEISSSDDGRPMEVSRASSTNNNGEKSWPVCNFSRETFESVEIAENVYQITKKPDPKRDVYERQKTF